ncbi:LLM class flavin-dependent oxidoreductase [Kitasatospora sp. NPDC059577]|uniref:LLM class flavin-dependent oxidoreductase n=1 Tax=unclassified Kitasatospora TaxID=2633591 RepID=UPI0036C06D14
MRIGVRILPSESWKVARHHWQLADQLGFHHAWTYDHVAWRERLGQTWFAAVPTLAAAAETTRNIRLGTLVSSPNFRHPVPFAKEIVTLDDLSDGRFIVGLGAGSGGVDAQVLANEPWSTAERSERFHEFVELTDRLLRTASTDYQGRYYGSAGTCIDPSGQARSRIPIAVAATGPKGMRTAARHADIWVTNGYSPKPGLIAQSVEPALVRHQITGLAQICREENRDPLGLRRLVLLGQDRSVLESPEAFITAVKQYEEAGATDLVIPFPHDTPTARRDMKVLERIAIEALPQFSAGSSSQPRAGGGDPDQRDD